MDEVLKNIEERRKQREAKMEEERRNFFKKCADKIDNGELIYQALALYIAKRYHIDTDYQIPDVVYIVLNYYFDNVDEDFEEWIHKENSPLIREASQLKKIFPEIYEITKENEKIVEIANQLYGLNLQYYNEEYEVAYVYSMEFDFNSFVPISTSEIKELKEDMVVLSKYNHDTSELEEKIKETAEKLGLTEEQIKLL